MEGVINCFALFVLLLLEVKENYIINEISSKGKGIYYYLSGKKSDTTSI